MIQHLTPDLILRELQSRDAAALASYFDALSGESKQRFQPHPLTSVEAHRICAGLGQRNGAGEAQPQPISFGGKLSTFRLVIEDHGRIVAYFILDSNLSPHEIDRYSRVGIALRPGVDLLFAPSVLDAYQNRGVASLAMPFLLQLARARGARSLVLMGGTQATNHRAIAFYEKFGFQRHGGYQTEVFNHDMRCVIEP